jgi:hypothetical protein
MKFCKDCKHFADYSFGKTCNSPKLGFDMVMGEPKFMDAYKNRMLSFDSLTDYCSPEGNWFEQKEARNG